MKPAVPVIAFFSSLLLASAPASELENKYDVLAKTLMPFVNVFAAKTKNPNRALTLKLRLESMTGMRPDLAGTRAEIAVEYPDKLRLHGPIFGEELTICRDGQDIWVFPGSKLAPLLEAARAAKKLPPPDPKFRLEPFRLPVPEKQLVFLPALFQVRDAGEESLDGLPCRVLDLQLMPELAKSLGPGWTARVWVDPNHLPTRLTLTRPDWQISVRFDDLKFTPSLPDSTWKPTADESTDVLKIPPSQYQQLLQLISSGK